MSSEVYSELLLLRVATEHAQGCSSVFALLRGRNYTISSHSDSALGFIHFHFEIPIPRISAVFIEITSTVESPSIKTLNIMICGLSRGVKTLFLKKHAAVLTKKINFLML